MFFRGHGEIVSDERIPLGGDTLTTYTGEGRRVGSFATDPVEISGPEKVFDDFSQDWPAAWEGGQTNLVDAPDLVLHPSEPLGDAHRYNWDEVVTVDEPTGLGELMTDLHEAYPDRPIRAHWGACQSDGR